MNAWTLKMLTEVSPEYVGTIVGKSLEKGHKKILSSKLLNRTRRVDRMAQQKFYKKDGYTDSFGGDLVDLVFNKKKYGESNKRYRLFRDITNRSGNS